MASQVNDEQPLITVSGATVARFHPFAKAESSYRKMANGQPFETRIQGSAGCLFFLSESPRRPGDSSRRRSGSSGGLVG